MFLISLAILLFPYLVAVAVQALALSATMPVSQYRKSQTVSQRVMRLNFQPEQEERGPKLRGSYVPPCLLENFHSHQNYKARIPLPRQTPIPAMTVLRGSLPSYLNLFHAGIPKQVRRIDKVGRISRTSVLLAVAVRRAWIVVV